MESKKVVLFIVEGPSDQSALSVILSKVFDQDEVYVYVVHGDVTAENGATPQNIVRKVNAFIKDHMSTYRLRKKQTCCRSCTSWTPMAPTFQTMR